MGRLQGRITKEDIRDAGFRRWDGQRRITTDWINIFFEPELYLPDGDVFVYLREPGQSSRGPAFKVHTKRLRAQGFSSLVRRCVPQTKLHLTTQCLISNCPGCDHGSSYELYIPAPSKSGLDATFQHHITTRNFFAWLYGLPLTGRALGKSIVDLKLRIDAYRPGKEDKNATDVIQFAEAQKYLDFRECVDHALAALRLAEALRVPDLWTDAFAHCVGMYHRGLRESIEYEYLSDESKILINQARLGMDIRLEKVCKTVGGFFEHELSSGFLGLPQAARDHLDRFRSFLHTYYIEQHGFWPPNRFEEEVVQLLICKRMYADFKNLYDHLADTSSSPANMDAALGNTGGVCVMQNVRNFDTRQRLQPLPQSLPRIPSLANNTTATERKQRRNSWNPIARHREEKERRNTQRMQALIDSTNRDWTLMDCVLVRRFSEFEIETAVDDLEAVSLGDGRKVRWIAIYAILQMLQSVTQAPKQVRNTDGLSYALCCDIPALMPWEAERGRSRGPVDSTSSLEPDVQHSHTNTAPPSPGGMTRSMSKTSITSLTASLSGSVKRSSSSTSTVKDRRKTIEGDVVGRSPSRKPSKARSASLRRFTSIKNGELDDDIPAVPKLKAPNKRASFCEIYVPGYGNGLNQVQKTESTTTLPLTEEEILAVPTIPSHVSVSRESSNASNNTTWSKPSSDGETTVSTPDGSNSDLSEKVTLRPKSQRKNTDPSGLDTVHFNTQTWDDMLGNLERRRFGLS